MTHLERFHAYLQAYANKDLTSVEAMLADDVTLCDWNLRVTGKAAALAETRKNFESSTTIAIDVLALYEGENSVSGELHITVDGTIELRVVDVLDFSPDGQIRAIRAYLGKT